MRCVVLSDSHLVEEATPNPGNRQGDLALILLRRLVHRLNRFVKPDAVLVLGDLINDPEAPKAAELYRQLRTVLDALDAPCVVLPGNHDLPANSFYTHFSRPPAHWDIAGVRFLSFVDPEEPGYNARRRPRDLARMQNARSDGWRGPVVALQHVPVFPPGQLDCPYNYTNADDILTAMRGRGIDLAISGHYHAGFDLLKHGDAASLAAPAVCEPPFPYIVVHIDRHAIEVERQTLAMPAEWRLRDTHLHTNFAYCSDNMTIPMAQRLCRAFNLREPIFTEHSGHLYFPRTEYPGPCARNGIHGAREQNSRFQAYIDALTAHGVHPRHRGIEIDADTRGRALIKKEDLAAVPFRVGAVHYLDCLNDPTCTDEQAADAYLGLLREFLTHRFQVLAHPFRVFGRARRPVPPGIEEPTVKLLKTYGTAAEINVHTHNPTPQWIARCLRHDVPLAFGSDAHSLFETGDFFPHIQLLRQAGFDGSPADVLIDWS